MRTRGIIEAFKAAPTWGKLLFITALGFILRLIVVWRAIAFSPDGFAYMSVAKSFSEGGVAGLFDRIWPPLYPLAISLANFFFGDYETSGRAVSLFFGALAVPLTFFLGKLLYDERIGLWAAFFSAVHLYMVRYSGDVLTEGIYYSVATAVIYCGFKAIRGKSAVYAVLTGVFSALAYLTRPEGAAFVGIMSLWFVFYEVKEFRRVWPARLRLIALMWAAFIVPAAPYIFFIHGTEAELSISGKMSPGSFVAHVERGLEGFRNLSDFVSYVPEAFTIPFFLFFLFFLWSRVKKGFSIGERYGLSIMGFFWIFYLLVNPRRRYFVELMPLALVFSAEGFCLFKERVKVSVSRNKAAIIVSMAVFFILAVEIPLGVIAIESHRLQDKQAGLYIKEHYDGSSIAVVGEKPVTAFYSGGRFIRIPDEGINIADVASKVSGKEATFLAVYESRIKESVKDFETSKARLEIIKSFENEKGGAFIVYKVRKNDGPAVFP